MNNAAKYLCAASPGISARSCQVDVIVITTNVDSEQQFPETQGNFAGKPSVNSQFGSAIAVIGDLEADGVGDLVAGVHIPACPSVTITDMIRSRYLLVSYISWRDLNEKKFCRYHATEHFIHCLR